MESEKRMIDANEVRDKAIPLEGLDGDGIPYAIMAIPVDAIDDASTVDAVEVVHSQWDTVFYQRSGELSSYTHFCPNCKYLYRDLRFKGHNYCPNCGAKMDGAS